MTIALKVEPLTRRRTDRKVYERSSSVERQITEANSLGDLELIERAKIRDFNTSGYFQEEVLVYLIRKFHRLENDSVVSSLTEVLIRRCAKHINKHIEATLDRLYVEDSYRDAIAAVFCQILDIESDRCDFAQVRFWFWLDRLLPKVLITYWRRQAQDWETDSLDDDGDEARQAELWRKIDTKMDHSSAPELMAINNEALNVLEPEERMLFMLRHYEEMDTQNKYPATMTISKYLGISDRAVRYRFEKIATKLQKWSGGAP
jgi:DNA-directed RNA polymerase specialized sigma24 family protein